MEVGPITRRGYCQECGIKVMRAAAWQMRHKVGPYYETYKAGIIQSAARLIDEKPPT